MMNNLLPHGMKIKNEMFTICQYPQYTLKIQKMTFKKDSYNLIYISNVKYYLLFYLKFQLKCIVITDCDLFPFYLTGLDFSI